MSIFDVPSDDCLPHDRAVWRKPETVAGPRQARVSIEYVSGMIIHTWMHSATWAGCRRWRFGWPPFEERK